MSKNIVIIGAVAMGPKVACRAKRLDQDAEILMIDRDDVISYGGCGIPYYVSGDVSERKALLTTTYHMVRDEKYFWDCKKVRVRTRTEALAIDRKAKTVRIKDLATGTEEDVAYDTLVLATGSTPLVPPVEGAKLSGVHTMANMHDADMVKAMIEAGKVSQAVIVGAGAIGLEMAEALADLWGIETTVVEMQPQILPQALGSDFAMLIQHEMTQNEVKVLTGERLLKVLGDESGTVRAVVTDKSGEIPCQLVLFAAGARPNAVLAREAGLAVGPFGGILVDATMRTSDANIFAGGDCVELAHLVSGRTAHLPLGSLANRQGRVIGTNVVGGRATFPGVVGTFIAKVFGLNVGRAGLTEAQARVNGFDPVSGIVAMADRAHFYPTQKMMYMKLVADRRTRTVLGIEVVGENGDAVKARVDAVAALLPHAPGVEEISNLEVAYAPPFASAMDILNACANTLENILDGRNRVMGVEEFLEKFHQGEIHVLDTRLARGAKGAAQKYGERWLSIPQEELAERMDEVPRDENTVLFCNSGLRSYDAQCYLGARGVKHPHVQGGWLLLRCFDPGFQALEEKD